MKVRGFEQINKVVPLILLNPISGIKTGKFMFRKHKADKGHSIHLQVGREIHI